MRSHRYCVRGRVAGAVALFVPLLALAGSFSVLSSSHRLSAYDAAVLSDHPAAFWDVSARGLSERDLTGHGHTGRYHGGTPRSAELPDGEPAADFNGPGRYLSIPSSPAFSISHTGALTWEAWIRPDTLLFARANDPHRSGYVDWMGKCGSYAGACEWEARLYSAVNPQGRCSRLSAYAFNLAGGLGSGADWQPACGMLRAHSWLYVVGEYQILGTPRGCARTYPGTINVWVNGVKQDFASHHPTGCMSQFRIRPVAGRSPVNIGTMALDSWFPGAVGKVAIYSTLLPQSEIDRHYQLMSGVVPDGHCGGVCTLANR